MMGRPRRLSPFWSRLTGRDFAAAVTEADRALEHGEAAVDRIAELVLENEELATELAIERQLTTRLLGSDVMLRAVIAASPEQGKRACLALSDRLEQMRAEKEHVEAANAQLRRELAVFGRAPSRYPPGVGYVPGRGPHGPSGHDGEYAGKCYCGYALAECDAYMEALRLYGHRVGEVSP